MTVLTDFVAGVKDWVDDADPSDALVLQWIRLAETRMNNELRSDVQIVRQFATFTDSCAVLPLDWLQTVYVRPQGGRPYDFITNHDYWLLGPQPTLVYPPDEVPVTQPGGWYTMIGRTLFIYPKVGASTTQKMEVAYYKMVTPLGDVADDVFYRYPDIYLNCTLAAAQPYLIEDERLQTFAALATAQIKTANESSMKARFSGSPLPQMIRSFG